MDTCPDARESAAVRRSLLAWYDRHKRDLPWRRTSDPYAIWLSEIMLQQTQVATVIPYYHRFRKRFRTVRALAAADLDDVLRLWAGLGYYARARSLHRAAGVIVNECGGRLPKTAEALLRLPGIGRYTAGAIASIAFGERAPIVDGNVARVMARLAAIDEDVRVGTAQESVWAMAERLVPRKRCGDFNQALMELGATVCLPGGAARCGECPMRRRCAAHAQGIVADLPVRTRAATVRKETHVVAAIRRGDSWLMVRRPDGGLWGGLWSLPTAIANGTGTAAIARRMARESGGDGVRVARRPFCDLTHQLTHRTIRFVGHVCEAAEAPPGKDHACSRPKGPRASARAALPLRESISIGGARQEVKDPRTRRAQSGGGTPLGNEPPTDARWLHLDACESLGLSRAMSKVVAALREAAGP